MTTKFTPNGDAAADAVFVEVLGPDGLFHHVGPFKDVSIAEDWIAKHSSPPSQRIANAQPEAIATRLAFW